MNERERKKEVKTKMMVKEEEGFTQEDILKKEAAVHQRIQQQKERIFSCCRKGRR